VGERSKFVPDYKTTRDLVNLTSRDLFGFVFFSLNLLRFGLLGGDALLSSPPGLLVLGPSGLGLIGQLLGPKCFRLLLVDEFHQDALVLKHVTLALDVELVVQMAIDLLVLSVLLEETAQDAHPPHPQLLDGHTRVSGTLALTRARMTTLSPGQSILPRPSARMNGLRLLDDQSVLNQAADVLSRICVRNLIDFVGVHPDFVPPALENGGGKPFLKSHRRHLDSSPGFNRAKILTKSNIKYSSKVLTFLIKQIKEF